MTYIRVQWLHEDSDFAVWLLSELDEERWETRKVEIFADGSKGYTRKVRKAAGLSWGLLLFRPSTKLPPPGMMRLGFAEKAPRGRLGTAAGE